MLAFARPVDWEGVRGKSAQLHRQPNAMVRSSPMTILLLRRRRTLTESRMIPNCLSCPILSLRSFIGQSNTRCRLQSSIEN